MENRRRFDDPDLSGAIVLNIVFYFQVHQPYRLCHYNVLDVAGNGSIFNETLNAQVIRKVAEKCYLPTNKLLTSLIDRFEGRFKIAYSITGTAIEQFAAYCPEVLESFRTLAKTGCVEFLGETYYHSLTFFADKNEFLDQVRMHRDLMKREFGASPTVFRNTELIYQDSLSDVMLAEPAYKVILAEGADSILKWRSPIYAYNTHNHQHKLLLKYYTLSDDIAFRFSNREWPEWPLTTDKFVRWLSSVGTHEGSDKNLFINLFMDYETFGEHQWSETGIFDFMNHLPAAIFKHPHMGFAWPSDAVEITNYPSEALSYPQPVSWADTERDLSAWLENDLQKNAFDSFTEILAMAKASQRPDLLETIRRLSTSDHFYYMCTKYFQDGDVHKYFSPYASPEQAYMYYMNALAKIRDQL